MPSFEIVVAAGQDDVTANAEGVFSSSSAFLYVGTISGSTDSYFYIRFLGLAIPRGNKIDSAVLRVKSNGTGTSALAIESRLDTDLTPVVPTTSGFRTRTYTTARGAMTVPSTVVQNDFYDINFAPALQEMVNKAGWANTGQNIGIVVKLQDPANTLPRRLFASLEASSTSIPKIIVAHSAPLTTVTAEATLKMPTPGLSAQGEIGSGEVAGQATLKMPTPALTAEAVIGTPPPVIAQATLGMPTPGLRAHGGPADLTQHTLFPVEPLVTDNHFLLTKAVRLLGFASEFDDSLGSPRSEALGLADDAWFAASNLGSREPGPLAFTAIFADHPRPRLARDRFVSVLKDASELMLPDGRIFGLDKADYVSKPNASSVAVTVVTTGAYPRHPLLSGTVSAAFPTVESTEEVPIYAVDAAGGIVAPLSQKRADRGQLLFALKANERGVLSLVSLGTPVAADGSSVLDSITVSYQGKTLVISLWGVETRIRESELATFGAVLVCLLRWTEHRAYLTVAAANRLETRTLPTGKPVDLSEQILTAGVRSDGVGSGAFMVLGSHSLGTAFFSPRVQTAPQAEDAAGELYREVTGEGVTWEVPVPDAAVELLRADNKALELAPGETITTDLAVKRTNYSGPLDFSTSSSAGLNVTSAFLSTLGDTDTYRLTVTAPGTTPEGTQTLQAKVKAQGADNEGSLLKEVRDDLSAIVEVAASPAIMPNATAVRRAFDPINQRATEMLRDYSANSNVFSWAGYARPDRRYMGLLATGKFGAAIFSDGLANAAQAQRMAAEQTYCMVWGEVAKTPVDGVLYQIAAVGSENGVHVIRTQGGFKLRTVNGATTVTSLDTLAYGGGNARHILLIGLIEVFLIDRDTGKSIRLSRPAWADAAVRTTVGALRSAAGAFTSVTRAHLLADTMHPYALSPIQQRRNIDALTPYVPTGDALEWPDNAFGLFFWDDDTAQVTGQKYKNHAAPALGITAAPVGTVDVITGGVYPKGGGSIVEIITGIPNTGVVTAFTAINAFKGSHTVAYEAQLGFADTVTASATAQLARHDNGQPFAMISNTDFNHAYLAVAYTPPAGDSLYKVRFNPPAKTLEVTAMANGAAKTVKSNNSYPGNLVVTLGGVRRASGSVDRRTPTRNRGLVLCRGETTADDNAIVGELLAA